MNALDFFDGIPEAPARREKLDPSIHVEPRDKGTAAEETRQAEFVAFVRKHCRGIEVAAVPNGAKRSRWERLKAQREGLRAGWPDTEIRWDGGAAAIEFKNGTSGPDQDQVEVLNKLKRWKQHVAVCRTAEGALRWLASIGAPVAHILSPRNGPGGARNARPVLNTSQQEWPNV